MEVIFYQSKDYIIYAHKIQIEKFGCNFTPPNNLREEGQLDYIIEMIQNNDYYPTIFDKAALILFNISENQIFIDGNKRTGCFGAILFMNLNFYKINSAITNDDLIDLMMKVSTKKIDKNDIVNWFKDNFSKI